MSWPWEPDCFPFLWGKEPHPTSWLLCAVLQKSRALLGASRFPLHAGGKAHCARCMQQQLSQMVLFSLSPLPCHVSSCCPEQILLKVRRGSGRAGRPAASVGQFPRGRVWRTVKGYNWRSLVRGLGVACWWLLLAEGKDSLLSSPAPWPLLSLLNAGESSCGVN